jgi:hypothetical protein
LLRLIRPPKRSPGSGLTIEDLMRAEREESPLCNEAHLAAFQFWYEMGGLKRPLSPVEAATTPAPLAKDFVYLLKRMRELADDEITLGEFVSRGLWDKPDLGNLYPQE